MIEIRIRWERSGEDYMLPVKTCRVIEQVAQDTGFSVGEVIQAALALFLAKRAVVHD